MKTASKLNDAEISAEELERNKQAVVDFYERSWNDKEPADAVAKYVGSEYIQHNPDTPDGAEEYIKTALAWFEKFPQINVDIKRVFAEGNFVIAHNLVKPTPDHLGFAGVDIFRLEAGKIVEHWDVRQPVPETPANTNGMF